jgi:parallel beta-helix repeat protein
MSCIKLPLAVPLLVLSGLCLFAFGCAGSSPSNTPRPATAQPSAGTLSISPDQAVLTAGNSLQFAASANRTADGDVNWMVNGVVGGNAASGTISRSGLYTAPQTVAANTQAVVGVMSSASPTSFSTAAVTVVPAPVPVKVLVSPSSASLHSTQVQQFTATVTGTTNHGVNWLVNGNEGGNSSVGTISSAGIYTAPPTVSVAHSVTITATSTYDSASSATAAVTILAAPASATPPTATPPPTTSPSSATNIPWNPTVLGVPWASDFKSIATNEIDVKMDPRLKVRAAGDGVTDDSSAAQAAIQLASSSGGGVVYFPAGNYKIVAPSGLPQGKPLIVPSRVILRGDSSTTSHLLMYDSQPQTETNWVGTWGGIVFLKASLSGMTDLGVYAVNSSSHPCALLWNYGSHYGNELFFNNLDVHLENCRSFWFEQTTNLLVQNSHIDSTSSQLAPIYVVDNNYVYFLNNEITYQYGRVQLQDNTNLLMQGNTLTRDAQDRDMQEGTAIESGGVELSFGQNVQVIDNTIRTLNAPDQESGDGEAIMTQNSLVADILDAGSVTATTSTTLTDSHALWGPVTASRLPNYQEVVAVLNGTAVGQWRNIKAINTSTKTLTLDQPWAPAPEIGALYSIFPWTLMHANIQNNTLIDNPNGIVLYDGCYDCTVQNNTLINSRGILLRAIDQPVNAGNYPESRRVHRLALQNKILNNTVTNSSGLRPAFVALNSEAFDTNYRGAGILNTQVGGNVVNPYNAAPSQSYDAEISHDGIFPCFLFGTALVKDPLSTVFQGISFWGNSLNAAVSYNSGFSLLATHSCVTPSAPPSASP